MDWEEYHSMEDMYSYLDYLESTYDFVTTEIIGKSFEGQDMRVAKVCREGCGDKPAVGGWRHPSNRNDLLATLSASARMSETCVRKL